MPAYLIINYDVADADQYGTYMAPAGPALGIGTAVEQHQFTPESLQHDLCRIAFLPALVGPFAVG